MTLDLKELQYLEQILIKTLPDKQSMVILQKVRNKIHKLSSWTIDIKHQPNTMLLSMITYTMINIYWLVLKQSILLSKQHKKHHLRWSREDNTYIQYMKRSC